MTRQAQLRHIQSYIPHRKCPSISPVFCQILRSEGLTMVKCTGLKQRRKWHIYHHNLSYDVDILLPTKGGWSTLKPHPERGSEFDIHNYKVRQNFLRKYNRQQWKSVHPRARSLLLSNQYQIKLTLWKLKANLGQVGGGREPRVHILWSSDA